MKCRNGFVSNSSSSSFILCYDKTKVLSKPEDIIEYVKEKNSPLIIRGWDCCEGEDIFELSEEQRSLIRKFPKQFIKMNSGTVTRQKWIYDENAEDSYTQKEITIPKIEAFPEAELIPATEIEYKKIEVDMSDISSEEYTEVKRNTIESDRILEKRHKLMNQFAQELRKYYSNSNKIPLKNIIAKKVDVSDRSCSSDYSYSSDFAERYLAEEDFEDISNFPSLFKKDKSNQVKSFAVICKDVIEDKKAIIKYLQNHAYNPPCYLTWFNEVYDEVYNTVTSFDLFELGETEVDELLKYASYFLKSPKQVKLFTRAKFINQYGELKGSRSNRKIYTGFGRVCFIPSESDLKDFRRNFIK